MEKWDLIWTSPSVNSKLINIIMLSFKINSSEIPCINKDASALAENYIGKIGVLGTTGGPATIYCYLGTKSLLK